MRIPPAHGLPHAPRRGAGHRPVLAALLLAAAALALQDAAAPAAAAVAAPGGVPVLAVHAAPAPAGPAAPAPAAPAARFSLPAPVALGAPLLAAPGDDDGSPSGSRVQRVRTCTLYANNAGFGAYCGSGARQRGLRWRDRLGGRPFVACRHDPVPSGVQTPDDPASPPGSWWLESCLEDVDLNSFDGGPDARTETRLVWVPVGRELREVPPWMDWLWDAFSSAYPDPVLNIGPTVRPRVNVPAYFWLEGPSAQTQTREVFNGAETITMQARLLRMEVDPGAAPGPGGLGAPSGPVRCPVATVPYDRSVGPFEQASTCTHTFRRSSASLPGHAYPVRADAFWQVGWVDAAGTFRALGTFTVSTLQLLPVQEVESLVRVTGG